jgi:RecB family exonuclease
MERVFLDWSRPALLAAAEELVRRFGGPRECDLSRLLVVVPVSRAGRRLLELLVEQAESRGLYLTPPTILTAGHLPERLYEARRPFADELTQHLAWIRALHQVPPEQLAQVLPHPPQADDFPAWLALGELLARLHRELAGDALSFQDVASAGPPALGSETPRWTALAAVQRAYHLVLDEAGLWDKQTARLYAIEHRECRAPGPIVLLATVDMNRAQRAMLDQVHEQATALILAPSHLADRFDPHGCLVTQAWSQAHAPITSDQVQVVDGPADQADAALRALGAWEGQLAAEEITIGTADPALVPYLMERLEAVELPARFGPGEPLQRSEPCRLLAAVAQYLESGTFADLAALIRCRAVDDWLHRHLGQTDPVAACDELLADRLPMRVVPWLSGSPHGPMVRVVRAVQRLLAPLQGARPLGHWSTPWAELLVELYGQAAGNTGSEPPERAVLLACQALGAALDRQTQLAPGLAPETTSAQAVRVLLAGLSLETIPPPVDPLAIEVLGWLELPLDDAPGLIVTGLNEGLVPASVNADSFLPDRLRATLQLDDNLRRYARDAYALCLLAASRPQLQVIAGRRTADGDPLWPSRLLLARPEAELPGRVADWFGRPQPAPVLELCQGIRPGRAETELPVPRPQPLAEPVTSMRVTEFRDYLDCPYRYYLRHRLRLTTINDRELELSGGQFGSLIHDVLKGVDWAALAACAKVETIEQALIDSLERHARLSYGAAPRPAVRLQIEQARLRLAGLARWQSQWAAQGWQVLEVEYVPDDDDARFLVDHQPMLLRGRIDRIDQHQTSGTLAVLDYKTQDKSASPEKVHRHHDDWIDLQLPLYRHLVAALDSQKDIRLGYIQVTSEAKVDLQWAEWTPAQLQSADEAARRVIRGVRQEAFWPPAESPRGHWDDLAAIFEQTPATEPEDDEGEAPA